MNFKNHDMNMMALGEVGSFVMGLVLMVVVFFELAPYGWVLRILGSLVTVKITVNLALRFVHMGYIPEQAGRDD